MMRLPKELSFENDEDGQCGIEYENWLIRDPNTDSNDIVAIVPKTGDEQYDNDVTYPLVRLLSSAPEMADMLLTLLPYIETAENDESYKPGAIRKLVSQLRELITKATGDIQ